MSAGVSRPCSHAMANLSTLRQGKYLPEHGSWWDKALQYSFARNPFSIAWNNCNKRHVDNAVRSNDNPEPWWTATHVSRWLHERCTNDDDRIIHSIARCWQHLLHAPPISVDANGLFPAFHEDIFGIKGVSGSTQWIFDSGATSTCTSDLSVFTSMSTSVPFKHIRVANGKYAKVSGIGDVELHISDTQSGQTLPIQLRNVLYIPEVPVNLISTRALWSHSRISSTFTDVCSLAFPNGNKIIINSGSQGHYYCIAKSTSTTTTAETTDYPIDDASCGI